MASPGCTSSAGMLSTTADCSFLSDFTAASASSLNIDRSSWLVE